MLATKKRVRNLLIFSLGIALAVAWSGCAPPGARALVKGEKLLQEGKYPEAVVKFEEATRAFPNHAKAWNHLGLGCQYAGDPKKAMQAYQKALTLDRNLTAASYNLGTLYLEQRNFPEAIARFTTFIQLEQKNPDGWFKLGMAQMQYATMVPSSEKARQLEAAKRNLDWSQRLRPAPETLNAIGLVQVQRGRAREAVSIFMAALKEQPDYSPALLNLAVVYHQYLNEGQLALVNYRQFLKVAKNEPETVKVHWVVRELEAQFNPPGPRTEPAQATQTNLSKPLASQPAPAPQSSLVSAPQSAPVARQVTPSPTPPVIVTNVVVASKISEPEAPKIVAAAKPYPIVVAPKAQPVEKKEPRVEVAKLPEQAPIKRVDEVPPRVAAKPADVAPGNSEVAANSVRSSPPSEANSGVLTKLNPATWYKKKPKGAPPVTTVPRARADAAGSPRGSTVETAVPIERAKVSEPEPVWPRYQYQVRGKPLEGTRAEAEPVFKDGVQAHKNRLMTEALEAYRRAMRLDPSFFEASYNFALVAREFKDFAGALAAYEQALAIQPESANARYNFAFTLQEAGYFADAANELQKLLAQNPSQIRAHLLLGTLCAERLNQTSSAREHYLKVLAAEPHHPQATKLRYWVAANQ